jgi:rhodanese-related sulfurtransferase/DNA-binding transcriptional ArsR family regulator
MQQSEKRQFKRQLYGHLARLGKALANDHRLELLEVLAQSERSVEQLAQQVNLSSANASQHLQVLLAAGLLEARREGVFVQYRLAEGTFSLWQTLRDLAQARLAEVDRLVSDTLKRDQHSISLGQLHQWLQRDPTTLRLLDVRPLTEYAAAHIPSALHAPLDQLLALLPSLPTDVQLITYCRGPYCVFADEAVALLHANGFQARRLDLGLPDWQAAGYPVASGVAA